jgi:NADH dehydrogenase
MTVQPTKVAIIGAGFAGLNAAQKLAKEHNIEVLLIDRNNYHTFTPLLYQVATSGLDPSSIAYPIRTIFRDKDRVQCLMGEVVSIDYDKQHITVQTADELRHEIYDYLLIATGSVTNFFGIDALEKHAFQVKSLKTSIALREHILRLFERASWSDDEQYKSELLTMVVVGGGPTGIETAGAMYELYNYVLKQEYDDRQELKARVILLEATDQLLMPYPESLRTSAKNQLADLGVEVMINSIVEDAGEDFIKLKNGEIIKTHTIVWSAGVKVSPLAKMLDVKLAKAGRIPVAPTMEVIGRENIYAAGDIVYLEDDNGEPYPMLIPVANQQGKLVAKNIINRLNQKPENHFKYNDRGIMATIGRTRAVAWIFYRIQLRGFMAWLAWLFLHLIMLMGFRNRISAFLSWVWNYFTYDRSVRIILDSEQSES